MLEDGMQQRSGATHDRTIGGLIRSYLYTALFCVGIGLLFALLNDMVYVWESIGVSFCIGLTIQTAFVALTDLFARYLSPYVAPMIIVAIGLSVGLLLAGTLVFGRPLLFFTSNFSTMVVGIFFGVVGFLIFGTRARLAQAQADLADAEAAQARQERLLAETELKLLQAQIEPHFLFNTLSNVTGLIRTDPDGAERTVLNLTKLLRASLNRTREGATTLGQELEIAQAYIDIQKIRMGDRLDAVIEAEPDLNGVHLPPLLVQPLIENAIKHGLEPLEAGGSLRVRVAREDNSIVVTVRDNGAGIREHESGGGTGLKNVRDRLDTLYTHASLTLADNPEGGVTATIKLPDA